MAARLCLNGSFAELLRRIRAEYLEMPGLRLTAPQAQRLFGLDSQTWDAISAALVDTKFLSHTHNSVFAMAAIPAVATGRISGIGVADEDFTSVEAALQVVEKCASRLTAGDAEGHVRRSVDELSAAVAKTEEI